MEDRFAIEKLQPIGDRLWTATFIVRTPETISSVDVRQAAELQIRFEYDQNSSASRLMETAHAKVRERRLADAKVAEFAALARWPAV